MTQHDSQVSISHMRDHADEAIVMASGMSRKDLDNNRMLVLALTRLLEIIGEAANRIPEDIRASHPHIAWRQIIGMRNRLIHGYDNINLDTLWSIVKTDLPGLKTELEAIAPKRK